MELKVVRHARARRMRLSVDPRDGAVRPTLPPRASMARAMAWAQAHAGWVAEQQARVTPARPLVPGAAFPFEGEDVRIAWDPARSRTPQLAGDSLTCGGPREGLEGRIERWLRRTALDRLRADTLAVAARAGVTVSDVGVGDARGRWGSCSASGAIRYSWRLILAPRFVRHATVAHEVAHRVHMNHSPAFHRLVALLHEDDPQAARAWLRRNGAALHRIGKAA